MKDNGYASRFIFLAPPDISELEQRLQRRGSDPDEKIKERIVIAQKELEHAKLEGFHDKIFVNDDLETTYKNLEDYIFGTNIDESEDVKKVQYDDTQEDVAVVSKEVEMGDSEAPVKEWSAKHGTGVSEGTIQPGDVGTPSI